MIPLGELWRLEGRRAVVTGGGAGIGAAAVGRLAEAGAAVVVADLDGAAADVVAKEAGGCATTVDVSDRASVEALATLAVEELGGIDIWVNNAGIFPLTPILDLDLDVFDRVQAVNLRGTFLGTAVAGRTMVGQGTGGVIVNLASTTAFRSNPGCVAYASSKHGVAGITKTAAIELGPHGIRVLALAPTMVLTPGMDEVLSGWPEGAAEQAASTHPLRRVGVPDDIARVIVFCASDMAGLMTGCVVPVDAGRLAT